MPTYNASKFLDESIKSVINQTYKNWEIILVDDFSKDNTRDIIKTWAEKEPRIKYFSLKKIQELRHIP